MEDELSKYREHIEQQIEERTAELKMTNKQLQLDITKRKRAEDSLHRSEKELKESQRVAQVGNWQWIVASDTITWSEELYRIIGLDLTLPPPTYKEHLKMYSQESVARLRAAVSEAMTNGTPYEMDMELLHTDGSQRFMIARGEAVRDAAGHVMMLRGTLQDITQRSRAEEALKKSEERYRRLVEFSPYGIAIHSESKLVYMNLAGAKILGTENPDEIVGKMLLQIIHPDYHEIVKNRVCMQEEGKVAPPLEEKFLRLDGTSVDVEVASIPFTYMGKQAIYGVFRDITERKKAEETRLENLRLEDADKAKSEFLANMSHELRTPLNSSIGFSELLKDGMAGELSDKQKHYVDNILTSNEFLLTLINDVLDLSKIEAGKIELVPAKMSVPVTIHETLSLIKEKAMKHNVLLKTEFDPEIEFIEADKQRFKQVLFNLLSNALKFSKETGSTLTITVKKEGDMAQISVSDTGIGIKKENLSKLFHKFEQLESGIGQKYGGTGLGLAITKQLVELHGGKIWAESRYGEGSMFTFLIPLKAREGGTINDGSACG